MIRTFVAIEIPPFQKLDELLVKLRGAGARISIPRIEAMHITLKFLGDVQENRIGDITTAIEKAASGLDRFNVNMVGTGAFPSLHNPRVLWVGISDDGSSARLAESIDIGLSGLGFQREGRPFSPHVTIGRVKSTQGLNEAIGIVNEYKESEFGEIKVEMVKLKKSTLTPGGSIYEDLASVRLR